VYRDRFNLHCDGFNVHCDRINLRRDDVNVTAMMSIMIMSMCIAMVSTFTAVVSPLTRIRPIIVRKLFYTTPTVPIVVLHLEKVIYCRWLDPTDKIKVFIIGLIPNLLNLTIVLAEVYAIFPPVDTMVLSVFHIFLLRAPILACHYS
jgi:hypothetical protein